MIERKNQSLASGAPRGRRGVLALVIAIVVGAVGLAFALAPGVQEQLAMGQRAAIASAEQASAAGDPREAATILQTATQGRPGNAAAARALLRHLGDARMLDEHYALLSSSAGRLLSAQDLRGAHRLYAANAQPDRANAALRLLAARSWARADELLALARADAAAGQAKAAAALARQIAADLAPGENPPAGIFVIDVLSRAGGADRVDRFAEHWLGPSVPTADVLPIASAILQSGHARLAVEALRPRREMSGEAANAFNYALRIGAQAEPGLRTELTNELLAQLPSALGEARATIIHDLFAYGNFDAAQSALVRTGAWREEAVRGAFIAAMNVRGRKNQLRDLLLAEASDATPQTARRAARELTEAGFAESASVVLKEAAEQEGPSGGAVRDLLYIWRAHDIAPDLAWLAERAAEAAPADASPWIEHIAQAGSPDAALAALARLQESALPESRAAFAVARVRYLGWRGDSAALRSVLADVGTMPLSTAQAAEVLAISCAVGHGPSARRAAQLLAQPGENSVRSCLARIALAEAREAERHGDHEAALASFAEAAEFTSLSAQDNFDYGYALENSGAGEPARRRYELALAALPSTQRSTERDMILRAAIVTRLGRPSEAGDILETLYAANPDNSNLRVLLADHYVNRGAYRMALQLTAAD